MGVKDAIQRLGLLKEAANAVGYTMPPVNLPKKRRAKEILFLEPEQIPVFVQTITPTKYAVGALLALCLVRLSEILAIDWADVPANPDFVPVRGAVVQGCDNKMVKKEGNKTEASTRNIPVYIPELREVLERDRKSPALCPFPAGGCATASIAFVSKTDCRAWECTASGTRLPRYAIIWMFPSV